MNPPVAFPTEESRVRLTKHGGVTTTELTPNRNTWSRAETPTTSVDASVLFFIHASTHFLYLSLSLLWLCFEEIKKICKLDKRYTFYIGILLFVKSK